MLTPVTFDALNMRQKTAVLMQQGNFLYHRNEPAYEVDGYKIEDFVVEIFYSKEATPQVIFRSFDNETTASSFFPEDKIHYLYQYIVRSHTA